MVGIGKILIELQEVGKWSETDSTKVPKHFEKRRETDMAKAPKISICRVFWISVAC